MSICNSHRKTAIIVFFSLILLLFLSLHFHIWSGNYIEGDLESMVKQHMDVLDNGSTEAEALDLKPHRDFLDTAYLPYREINAWFQSVYLTEKCFSYYFFRPSITLCSLSVRMDD